jgi:hypothetical protein
MDAGTISALLIAVTSLLGWLVSQTQARNRAVRGELRWRRNNTLLMSRYIYRLEAALASRDLPLPEKPEGWDDMESEQW